MKGVARETRSRNDPYLLNSVVRINSDMRSDIHHDDARKISKDPTNLHPGIDACTYVPGRVVRSRRKQSRRVFRPTLLSSRSTDVLSLVFLSLYRRPSLRRDPRHQSTRNLTAAEALAAAGEAGGRRTIHRHAAGSKHTRSTDLLRTQVRRWLCAETFRTQEARSRTSNGEELRKYARGGRGDFR